MNSREYDVAQLDELVGVDGREVLTRRLRWRHEERDTRPASAGLKKGNLIPATPPSSPPPLPGPIVDAKTIISFLAAPAKRTTTTTPFLFAPHPFSLCALLILIHLHAMHTPLSHFQRYHIHATYRRSAGFSFEAVVLGFGGDANIA